MTQVAEVMTRGVRAMAPDDSVRLAAQAMDELNVGVIPVCEDDGRVVGMVTDRDIVLRAVAQDLRASATPLSEVMTNLVQFCYEDQPLAEVVERMERAQIRRVPVLDHQERLVGILSLGDAATRGDAQAAAQQALSGISTPSEPDRQHGLDAGRIPSKGWAPDEPSAMPE
ncbi:CBS domain-containing protein [Azohydromonas caseinilytica]|uniref:CBS domain-containing protein n=1 Tax=Azohydromonas caseinilytica TaxID=2728836 RepID=A0A848F597_9BURK|nr:CBS domain-containing protein [Azohydromonas caseinilytica]NML14784.1 CBS domain-containing protein [Azohydromonas caseinilytica]